MGFSTVKIGKLEYLTGDGIRAPHGFTTRLGGVSRGRLESLNIGLHRGDAPENVLENYRILGAALGFAPEDTVLTKQVHGDVVLRVGRKDRGAGLFVPQETPCDGLITNEPGVALVIFTADCTPILFHDPVTGAVGAVHAGWRGTAAQIGARAVEAMAAAYGCKPENIRAAIGPNIGKCCFETHGDVPQAMEAALGQAVAPYIRPSGDKFYVDLKGINAHILRMAGVRHVDISEDCTACQPRRFWSHRITGGDRGSQGAVILCGREKP